MSQIYKSSASGPPAPGTVIELTGDTGGPVPPDAGGNINVLGQPDINVAGNAGTNTLTWTDLTKITPFVVDQSLTAGTEVAYSTIQSALDAANTAFLGTGIPQAVYVRPGAYVENLTLYEGVDLHSVTGQVDSHFTTVTGVHALPASGDTGIYGIWFIGDTACFTAPIGGTTKVNMFNVITQITGVGYSFDIDGFSGELNIFDYLQFDGGTNGFVNNPTGGCEVNIIFAGVGLSQSSATAIISGNSFFQGMLVSINMNFVGTSNTQINMGCELQGTITVSDSASVDIANTYCFLGSVPAFIHNSTANSIITNSAFNTTNPIPIQGTGTGGLQLLNVANVNTFQIAPTVNTPNILYELRGTGQTVDVGTADLLTYELRNVAAVYSFQALISGISVVGSASGVQLTGTIKTNGAVATIVGTVDQIINQDLAIAGANVNAFVSGNDLIVRATGSLGAVINWNVNLTFKQITN